MTDDAPQPPSDGEQPVVEPAVADVPVAEAPFTEPSPAEASTSKPSRSWRRLFMVLGAFVVSTWVCCGVIGFRSCASLAPGSQGQTAARAVARQYLDAVSVEDWARMYELSDPANQSAQPLEVQRDLFLAHPELFAFDDASFEGHNYFSNMSGGDRMRLTGRLTGRSPARRTFRLDLQQQPDETWRVRAFHVNMDLATMPAATPSQPPP